MFPKYLMLVPMRATRFRKSTLETIIVYHKQSKFIGSAIMALALSTAAIAKDKHPEISHDGLTLIEQTKYSVVYVNEGETLEGYDKVMMTDVYVAFKKNWQRDYNRNEISPSTRVSDKDVEEIKKQLAVEFKDVFTEQLEKGGYPVVTTTGEDVLLLRPAIINLDVTAPDINKFSVSSQFVASTLEMTLFLELYDSMTSAIITRVVDSEADRSAGMVQRANSVSNKAAADRAFRSWADSLVKRLDEVNAGSSGDGN